MRRPRTGLDILFNNAGVSFPVKVEDITVEILERVARFPAKGVFSSHRRRSRPCAKWRGSSSTRPLVMGSRQSQSPAYRRKGAIRASPIRRRCSCEGEYPHQLGHPGYSEPPRPTALQYPAVRQLCSIARRWAARPPPWNRQCVLFLASDEAPGSPARTGDRGG